MALDLRPPWLDFLTGRDRRLPEPIELHCAAGFVMTILYGLRRTTADLDYFEAIPMDSTPLLLELAGPGSELAKACVHLEFAAVALGTLPEGYEERLIAIAHETFQHLRLFRTGPLYARLGRRDPSRATVCPRAS